MLDVLTFIFQDFWHWLGTALLLVIAICWTPIRITNSMEDDANESSD